MTGAAPKYYIHNDGLNEETIKPLIDFVNFNEGQLVIAINSTGGGQGLEAILRQMLAENSDRITLVAVAGVSSAAFKLFYQYDGKKVLTTGCIGMWHYGYRPAHIDERGKLAYTQDKAHVRSMKQIRPNADALAESFMNETELRKFRKGDDVYFDFERMKQIFPDAIIWD